jgi:hypothetical protein
MSDIDDAETLSGICPATQARVESTLRNHLRDPIETTSMTTDDPVTSVIGEDRYWTSSTPGSLPAVPASAIASFSRLSDNFSVQRDSATYQYQAKPDISPLVIPRKCRPSAPGMCCVPAASVTD